RKHPYERFEFRSSSIAPLKRKRNLTKHSTSYGIHFRSTSMKAQSSFWSENMFSPRQIFEDNIRPADLLLKVFRLLEHDALNTEVALLRSLRELVKAEKDESLLVISNGIFLGLIRELAEVPPSSIKRSALCNLLRQAVVTASTALETYLPILLRDNLPEVIRLRGRDFVPRNDEAFKNQFKELKQQAAASQPQVRA